MDELAPAGSKGLLSALIRRAKYRVDRLCYRLEFRRIG